MVHSVLRWGIGLTACALLGAGCGDSCEDDGFGGANCVAPPIGEGMTSGGQTSTGADGTSSTTGSANESTSGDPETSTGEDATSTGAVGSQTWCADADQDGFGNPDECQEVSDDEEPPAGAVTDDTDCDDGSDRTFPGAATQESTDACTKDSDEDGWADASPPDGVEAGTDCDDDDGFTFPGSAELDDDAACMRDADDDGYGDTMPPRGGTAGTDCNDDDADVPSANACLTWCLDSDDDQYGDPDNCVSQVDPPKGHVGNDADCDDSNAEAFPGAAPNDDGSACMLDADGDDYGDSAPANAAITAGSDCDDLEALVFDACFDCPAGTFFCNGDDNASQCNATGTWGVQVDTCNFGCDDMGGACWTALTADTGTCAEMLEGGAATLSAGAMGGDGNYAFAWTPSASLSADDTATVTATPLDPTTYAVAVSDGEGNAAGDEVTLHITDQDWNQLAPGCASYVWADIFDAPAPPPNNEFPGGGPIHCNTANNSLPNAYVCPQVIEQAQVAFDLEVVNNADNDGIGFVFGWQDASHFYLLSWKQSPEAAPWGQWEEGITIKRIEADDPADITGEDLAASYDTAHGTVLATPAEFHPFGWANRVLYRVFVDVDGDTTTITIVNQDTSLMVAMGDITDPALGPGAIGSYNASQRSMCTDHWNSSCL